VAPIPQNPSHDISVLPGEMSELPNERDELGKILLKSVWNRRDSKSMWNAFDQLADYWLFNEQSPSPRHVCTSPKLKPSSV
jgi:hypothetical protein